MKFAYAILAILGWLWLAAVVVYLFVVHPRVEGLLEHRRHRARGFDVMGHHEE